MNGPETAPTRTQPQPTEAGEPEGKSSFPVSSKVYVVVVTSGGVDGHGGAPGIVVQSVQVDLVVSAWL